MTSYLAVRWIGVLGFLASLGYLAITAPATERFGFGVLTLFVSLAMCFVSVLMQASATETINVRFSTIRRRESPVLFWTLLSASGVTLLIFGLLSALALLKVTQ